MLALDSSALVALFDADEPFHGRVRAVVEEHRGPLLIPAGILGEAWYVLAKNLGPRAVLALLEDLKDGRYLIHCGENDFDRIAALVTRYGDMALDAADASVIACAEGNRCAVVTTDRRDFDVIARETGLTVLPSVA